VERCVAESGEESQKEIDAIHGKPGDYDVLTMGGG